MNIYKQNFIQLNIRMGNRNTSDFVDYISHNDNMAFVSYNEYPEYIIAKPKTETQNDSDSKVTVNNSQQEFSTPNGVNNNKNNTIDMHEILFRNPII